MKKEVGNNSNREEWIDSLKGIFIFLVVLGHLIAFWGAGETDIFGVVHYFIYAVHMPMFILISGYLSKASCDRRKIIKNYIIPYVLFDFLYALYLLVLDGDASHLNILFPYFVFWYILCLGIMRVILSLTKGKWQGVIVMSALTLIAPFIGETSWRFLSLGRVVLLYGIFYTGYLIKDHIAVFQKHKPIAIGIGCLCILLEVILLCIGVTGTAWATHDYPNSITECLIKWVYMYIITVGLFIMSSAVMPDLCKHYSEISEKRSHKPYYIRKVLIGGGIKQWGRNSVTAYLLHPFVLKIIWKIISVLNINIDIVNFVLLVIAAWITVRILCGEIVKNIYNKIINVVSTVVFKCLPML